MGFENELTGKEERWTYNIAKKSKRVTDRRSDQQTDRIIDAKMDLEKPSRLMMCP